MRTVFRAADEPLRTRLDRWQQVMSSALGPLDLTAADDPDFEDVLALGELGAVRVGELVVSRSGYARRTSRHVRDVAADSWTVDVLLRGEAEIAQGDRRTRLVAGDLTLVDPTGPGSWRMGRAALLALVVPRALVPLPRHDLDGLVGVRIPGDRGLGALVSSFTRRLPRHLDDGDAAARARVGTALVDLITAALAERVDRSGRVPARIGREVLRQQVVTYVERNLADPGLTPRAVAAANALSLRSLHQLFEAEPTTVAAFIRQRRVDACRRDLADPAMAQVAVAEIGARWGLRDPAHFSRVFRRTAGLTPTAFRERALA